MKWGVTKVTYLLNNTIDTQTDFSTNISFNDGNGNSYTEIAGAHYTETGEPPDGAYGVLYDGNYVYTSAGASTGWLSNAYRTLIFDEEPTGDLLTWLNANGTRQ